MNTKTFLDDISLKPIQLVFIDHYQCVFNGNVIVDSDCGVPSHT